MKQTTSKIIKKKCKRSDELDAKIKRVNEAYQKLMKPVAVTKLDKAFKDAARSFEVSITNGQDPLMQLHGSNMSVDNVVKRLLVEMNGYKMYATIKIAPKKQKDNEIALKSAYFNGTPQIITDNTNIYKTLGIIAQELLNLIG